MTAECQAAFKEIEHASGKKGGYPTWVINGKAYFGWQALADLAKYSSYEGPSEFENPLPDADNFRPGAQEQILKDLLKPLLPQEVSS